IEIPLKTNNRSQSTRTGMRNGDLILEISLFGKISNLFKGGRPFLICFSLFEVQTKRPFPVSCRSAKI
ncbi:hypothetical protein, partial [Megamonas sp.]|uniref:hypothetical protein n=1 Tax=Megamonas sp. TaxID=2049033 RepID=UPI0019E366BC